MQKLQDYFQLYFQYIISVYYFQYTQYISVYFSILFQYTWYGLIQISPRKDSQN